MGLCDKAECTHFLNQAPLFEDMLIEDGSS